MKIDDEFNGIILHEPTKEDGDPLNLFIRVNPPLDMNSTYCNVLSCHHFSETCIVAKKDGRIIGYVTGYRLPKDPSVYFLWQVGVGEEGRGQGLAGRMIQAILSRESCRGVKELQTTVTKSNQPSRKMFAGFAKREGAEMTEEEDFFSSEVLGGHDAESLFHITPLSTPKPA